MSLGISAPPRGYTYGHGGTPTGGGFLTSGIQPAPAPASVNVLTRAIATAPLSQAPTSIPYYDPSRVIDESRLRLVKDIRDPATRLWSEYEDEFADERGDVQTGDNGITGPGSTGAVGAPGYAPGVSPTEKPALTPANLGLLAVAAFLLFGG